MQHMTKREKQAELFINIVCIIAAVVGVIYSIKSM